MTATSPTIVVIGGGAAGFFAAVTCAEANPQAHVTLLERSGQLLSKVRISGGGRCNVTHSLFDPALLVENYPRGGRALRGPLTRFGPRDTVQWFAARGVELVAEGDGRMFPVTNSSETIVDCLLEAAKTAGVEIRTKAAVASLEKNREGFSVELATGELLQCERLLLATGSNAKAYAWAQALGHSVEPPAPSLFTFNVTDPRLEGLAGISVPHARVRLDGTKLEQRGPLLITHWGLSGPAVLKLSAWGARELQARNYRTPLEVNWLGDVQPDEVKRTLAAFKEAEARKTVVANSPVAVPQRLWRSLVQAAGILESKRWADVSKLELTRLADELSRGCYQITGKGVFKEEFVTCGGVSLNEVNFKTMESRLCPGLYFAGEVLDIDGVTGGFNFQSAWATGWLAGRAMADG